MKQRTDSKRTVTYCPNCIRSGQGSKPQISKQGEYGITFEDDPEAVELDCGRHCKAPLCLKFRVKDSQYCKDHAWSMELMKEGGYPYVWEKPKEAA